MKAVNIHRNHLLSKRVSSSSPMSFLSICLFAVTQLWKQTHFFETEALTNQTSRPHLFWLDSKTLILSKTRASISWMVWTTQCLHKQWRFQCQWLWLVQTRPSTSLRASCDRTTSMLLLQIEIHLTHPGEKGFCIRLFLYPLWTDCWTKAHSMLNHEAGGLQQQKTTLRPPKVT